MAKKPNYDFERRERDRMKSEKKAARAAEKKELREQKKADPELSDQTDTMSSPTAPISSE